MSYTLEAASQKRRVFFSFHYADIMRVNNVRNCGAFKTSSSDSSSKRSIEGFYDRSLWEAKKLAGPDALKQLIRDGIHNTSAICVLAGTSTWERRWVRFEIARGVIENRGLLTVYINSLMHHQDRKVHPHGPNPLDYLGIYRSKEAIPKYYIYEKNSQGNWGPYGDYTLAVDVPNYLTAPASGYVTPLSQGTKTYDFVSGTGHANIGSWIDGAARAVGR